MYNYNKKYTTKNRNKEIKADLTIALCKKLSKKRGIKFTDYTDVKVLNEELTCYVNDGIITVVQLMEAMYENFNQFTSDMNKGINTEKLDFEARVNQDNQALTMFNRRSEA